VSPFALFLALVCAVRPTALAAVAALLASERPRRLLLVYVVAGLAESLAVGLLLVLVFRTAAIHHAQPRAGVELALGLIALLAARAALREAARPKPALEPEQEAPESARRARRARLGAELGRRMRDPSATTAAAAGVLTHLPGLFYLMGLNAIIGTNPAPGSGIAQVVIFNAIWFAIPIAALLASVRDPEWTKAQVERATAWFAVHSRQAVPAVLIGVGIYLIARGVIEVA
jgi:hypothetical protein